MSAHMHGFGVHLGVYYQYWGGGGHSGAWLCVLAENGGIQKLISVLAWLISWAIHRRGPGIALALHSQLWDCCTPLWLPLEPHRLWLLQGCCLHVLATPSYHGVIKGSRGRAKF